MSRKGFALLTVLWVIAALGLTASEVLVVARTGITVSINRSTIRKAEWARDACESILRARFAADSLTRSTDRVDLGSSVWCRASLEDVGTLSTRQFRLAVPGDSNRKDFRGVEPRDPIAVTQVNLNAASDSVIARMTGIDFAAARALVTRRRSLGGFPSMQAVLSSLPPLTANAVMQNYSRFASSVTLRPIQFIAHIEGGVSSSVPRARALLVIVPAGRRLVVVRRDEL